MGWPLAESEDYETIAGWVLSMLDTVPQMGYSFEKDGYRFTIHSMRRRRILAVRVGAHIRRCLAGIRWQGRSGGAVNRTRQLYRSRNALVGGVCAGIAERFDVDPLVVRILS